MHECNLVDNDIKDFSTKQTDEYLIWIICDFSL